MKSDGKLDVERVGGVTLAEVAARAGVSTVAASVVLNGSRSGARVSAATRERIVEAATELRYSPNALARSLRRRRTNVLAFHSAHNFIFNPSYPFYGAVLSGMQEGCVEAGKDLLLHGGFGGRGDEDILQKLLNGQVDGIVLYARESTPLTERLVESRLPVVSVVNEVPNVPWVGIDDAAGGRLLAAHLAQKGHRRVLYRRTNEQMPATLSRRFEAFCQEAAQHGIELLHSRCNGFGPDEEERALLLAPPGQRPDAVACWSDYSADGIAAFCRESGLRVPEDVAIVGFDGLTSTVRPAPRLTTIRAPWSRVASTAVSLLSELCEGRTVPPRTMLPVEFLAGDTT